MKSPLVLPNESDRLDELNSYNILDTLPEILLDDITQLASQICETPIALISLIDKNRQWFKSKKGLDLAETHKDISFCGHAILENKIFEISNTLEDSRFFDNPLVTGEPNIRFYAGMPLTTSRGFNLGTLCVVDKKPRKLSAEQLLALITLARQVVLLFENRLSLEELSKTTSLLDNIGEIAKVGGWELDLSNMKVDWTKEVFSIYELKPSESPSLSEAINFYAPEARPLIKSAIDRAIADGTEWDLEVPFITAKGRHIWVRSQGAAVMKNGQAIQLVGAFQDITERKHIENKLIKSEERYKLAMEAATDGLWDWNVLTDEVYYSPRWKNMLGYLEFGNNISDGIQLLHPDDKVRVLSEMEEFIGGNADKYQIEFRMQHRDGRYIDILSKAFAVKGVFDGTEKITRVVGTHFDITERKIKELALNNAEERYALAMKGSQEGLWDWNLLTNNVYFSPRWKSMLGYAENEIKDTFSEWERLVHPDDLDNARLKVKIFVAGNSKQYESEFRMQHKHGQYIDILSRAFAVEDVAGKISRVVGTHYDITERKLKEKSLEKAEERLAFAVMAANVGVWDWNLSSNDVYFSPRWKSMLGYAENEIKDTFSEWERLVHPEDLDAALSKTRYYLNDKNQHFEIDFRMQHKNGSYINIHSDAFVIADATGKLNRVVGTHLDVTDRKKANELLIYQAQHDALTGLINRAEFERRTERLLVISKEQRHSHAMCYMDLDQFKVVNDTCGHAAGDEMLRQLSSLLQKIVRNNDTLARLGGDEFGILMEHCSLDDAYRVAFSIQTAVQDYLFMFEGQSFRISASMGLVPITDTTINLRELLKNADVACYMAKDRGRNRIHVQRDEDVDLVERHGEMQWVNRIQRALDENRFCLYAQAAVELSNPSDIHYELLIRMLDEQGGLIPPGAFLPAAERYNLITQLDQWVINDAFKALNENPDFQRKVNFISINLSGLSLNNEMFLDFVVQKFYEYKIDGEKICFEITETAAIFSLIKAGEFISELKQLGCRFALDDFGSGLSSYGYLKNLSVNYLKIDGIFVKDMACDPVDHAMVKSINDIGHIMGMKTIAEFVENDKIKGMLREIGVDYAQGYGIHKPQPFYEIINGRDSQTVCHG